jgi:hypothetical protein
MTTFLRTLAAALFLFLMASSPAAAAQMRAEWDGVSRIVVIADLEGDYEKFTDMLRTANLIDARNNWTGARAHLVQLGDIPDRGPHSRMIMELLMRLEPQAQLAGGFVHALIGNHEAMNIEGATSSPTNRPEVFVRLPISQRIGLGSSRTSVGVARIWPSRARIGCW